jgi:hypothetical protein
MPLYERFYPRAYAPRWYQDRLRQRVDQAQGVVRSGRQGVPLPGGSSGAPVGPRAKDRR